MIERVIQAVLDRGLTKLKADTAPFERHLKFGGLPPEALVEWRKQFLQDGLRVIQQFPTKSHTFPLASIVVASTMESIEFLGDEVDIADEAWGFKPTDPEYVQPILGAVEKTRVTVTVWAENPDVCRWAYVLLRWILRRDEDSLLVCEGPVHTSGAELFLDPERFGDHLFARQITLEIERLDLVIDEGAVSRKPMAVGGKTGIFLYDPTGANKLDGIETTIVPTEE